MVGCRRLPAAVASPASMAVRKRRIIVRTRVRLARFTSARWRDCAARFKTDFFFFLTLVACPWAIYCSFCVPLKLLTLNEATSFVKRAERSFQRTSAAAAAETAGFGQHRGRSVRPSESGEQARRTAPAHQLAAPDHHRGNAGRGAARSDAAGHRDGVERAALRMERHDGPRESPWGADVQHGQSGAGGFEYRADSGRWDFSAERFCALLRERQDLPAAARTGGKVSNGAAFHRADGGFDATPAGPRRRCGAVPAGFAGGGGLTSWREAGAGGAESRAAHSDRAGCRGDDAAGPQSGWLARGRGDAGTAQSRDGARQSRCGI